jgi:hypothetical protein
MVDVLANGSIGDGDREHKRSNASQGSLSVFSGIVRLVRHGIRQKSADAQKGGACPFVGEVAGKPGERQHKSWKNGQQACLTSYHKMRRCERKEISLDHQQQANRTRFRSFMPAEHKPKLMLFMEKTGQVHFCSGVSAKCPTEPLSVIESLHVVSDGKDRA